MKLREGEILMPFFLQGKSGEFKIDEAVLKCLKNWLKLGQIA